MTHLLLKACRREAVPRPPVWLMRQAGRYLPQYRAVRERHDFLTMVTTPELAARVTLQPVDILGVDAAIIFSDILVIPMAMGMSLQVTEGVGPVFAEPLRHHEDIERLQPVDPESQLGGLLSTLRMVRRELGGRVPLIGFVGAPWTLASYMVEGSGTREWRVIRRMVSQAPATVHRLLHKLSEAASRTAAAQADAGADVIQIFESSAGALGPEDFETIALPHLVPVVARARAAGVPVILFAPGAGWALELLARATGADVMGIDWQTSPESARERLSSLPVACQGNFNPAWLYGSPDSIRARVKGMIGGFGHRGYIANLGHGVLRDTPVEHVQEFVAAVREWRPDSVSSSPTLTEPGAEP